MSSIIELRDVHVRRGMRTILGPISWKVEPGQRWVILGPNGAGKTTLLNLCATFMHPTQGSVDILGHTLGKVDVFELRPRIGFASSAMGELLPADELVIDIVLTAAYAVMGRWIEEYDLWDESRAKALLTIFGVREIAQQYFGTLSEGERKRVQISRSLMADPELLLLDEPAAGLDLGGREDILRRISDFMNDPSAPATVIVTHHIEEIPSGTTHCLLIKDGKALAQGPIGVTLTSENLTALYGIEVVVQNLAGRYFARAQ